MNAIFYLLLAFWLNAGVSGLLATGPKPQGKKDVLLWVGTALLWGPFVWVYAIWTALNEIAYYAAMNGRRH